MAKSLENIRARELRKQGLSIKTIATHLGISKSSASIWCRDIELTQEQKLRLMALEKDGVRKGQLLGATSQKQKRLKIIGDYKIEGVKEFKLIKIKEHLAAGLALYVGEGSKGNGRVKFANGDPRVIKFMMDWFMIHFKITPQDFIFRLNINESHRLREKDVIFYWQDKLNITSLQFRKTTFVVSKQKKIYENHNTYYGTITFTILKSTDLLYRIQGLMTGLLEARIAQMPM